MERILLPASLILLGLIAIALLLTSGGAAALVLTLVLTAVTIALLRHYADNKQFAVVIFLVGLSLRLAFGLSVHLLDLREFFGGDANTYDFLGNELLLRWTHSVVLPNPLVDFRLNNLGTGWGMFDLVAAIYYLVGRNILAAQCFCAVIGAAAAPLTYFCAQRVFQNNRVARGSAYLLCFFPAFIIWSGQLLKDGLLIFLLVLSMTMVIELQRKFNYAALVVLLLSVACVLTLRFYIFYMLAPAIAAAFVIGTSASAKSIVRSALVLIVMGLGLTYLGTIRDAGSTFEIYGNLNTVQNGRLDLSTSANSGFASDVDVSTTGGAISTIPIGLAYLMLAPFPWEMSSWRSGFTVPEVLVWWAMLPLMMTGLAWTVRHNLRRALPILIFSFMLTLTYSIFQGNVGTAYRQRTQIQVFLFMFIAVGWTVRQEKKENEKISATRRQAFRSHVRTTGAVHL